MWINLDTESRHFYNSHLLFFSSQKELPEWWTAVNKMRNNWGVGGNLTKQTEANFQAEVRYGHCRALLWFSAFCPSSGGWNESKWQNSKAGCHYLALYLLLVFIFLLPPIAGNCKQWLYFSDIYKTRTARFQLFVLSSVWGTVYRSHYDLTHLLPELNGKFTFDFRAAELSQETQVLGMTLNSEWSSTDYELSDLG